jgi:hypothetical protein
MYWCIPTYDNSDESFYQIVDCWRTTTGVYSRETTLGKIPIFGNGVGEISLEVLQYLVEK